MPRIFDNIYRYPLRHAATDRINRQMRSGITDIQLADLVVSLREDDRLCIVEETENTNDPRIVCSLGLFRKDN
jgi:hypothetical protein